MADKETPKSLWTAYLKAYGPISADERKRLLTRSVAEDVVFTNPNGDGNTLAGLISHIEDFQSNMPGAYFKADKIYEHHGEMLAIWSIHKPDNSKVTTGYNFVRFDEAGRFKYMAGFF